MSLPMLRPHCEDVSNKGFIKTIKAVSILLHGDPDEEFPLELEKFIFCGHTGCQLKPIKPFKPFF